MNNLLRKVDLTSLRLFIAVCQEKNIARAAERECIAPSAVSRRIAEIETLIGLPVIQRQSRGITVTLAGQTVLRHALAIIANVEAMGAELSQLHGGIKGDVRLVANLSSMVQFLPEDIAAFQRLFPDINVDIEEQNSIDIVRTVEERRADFGICIAHTPGADALDQLPYRTDRLSVIVPRQHRVAAAAQIDLAALARETFVGLSSDSALTALIAQQARRAGFDLTVRIRVSSLDALCRMVHVGLGMAIVPHQVGQLYLNTLDVALIPLAEPWATRALVIVCKARAQLSATAGALAKFLDNQG